MEILLISILIISTSVSFASFILEARKNKKLLIELEKEIKKSNDYRNSRNDWKSKYYDKLEQCIFLEHQINEAREEIQNLIIEIDSKIDVSKIFIKEEEKIDLSDWKQIKF